MDIILLNAVFSDPPQTETQIDTPAVISVHNKYLSPGQHPVWEKSEHLCMRDSKPQLSPSVTDCFKILRFDPGNRIKTGEYSNQSRNVTIAVRSDR